MSRKVLLLASSALILAAWPALIHAQGPGGPPPPFPGGGRGFGGGGFKVVGVEGCLTNRRPVPSGTPGFAASITYDHKEASFNGAPPSDRSSTEQSYRDNSGVTYTLLTLPSFGKAQNPRTVICIDDPNLHIRLVVDPNPNKPTALEFQTPDRKAPSGNGQSPKFGNGGPGRNAGNPPFGGPNGNANVSITHPAAPAAVAGEITTYCPDAQTTLITRKTPNGDTDTDERVYCPSLFLTLFTQNGNSHSVSTTTANITATGSGVNLANLPVPYPLPSNFTVTMAKPRGGRRGSGGFSPNGAQPQQQ